VGTREWDPTPTYDAIIGDLVGGQLRLGTASIGMADSNWAGVATDDIFILRNTATPVSEIEFMIIGSDGNPRLVLPSAGNDNATYNPRSMLIGPAATFPNTTTNMKCSTNDSGAYTHIDCNTSATGADLGVQDDIETGGNIWAGEDIYAGDGLGGTMYAATFRRSGSSAVTFGSVDTLYLGLNTDEGAMIFDNELWHQERANHGAFSHTPGFGTWWIKSETPNVPVFTDDASTDFVLNYMPPACMTIPDPVTSETIESVWRASRAVTITQIWCETDAGTVGLDIDIDDGTPLGINGTDISCAVSAGTSDTAFANSAVLAAGDRLDISIGTVTTAVSLRVCWYPEAIL